MATTLIDTDRLLLHIMGLRRDRQQSGSLSGGGAFVGAQSERRSRRFC